MTKMKMIVTSPPDREELVVELWCGDVHFAELSMEDMILRLEIYAHPDGQPWQFELKELMTSLESAKTRLAEMTGTVLE